MSRAAPAARERAEVRPDGVLGLADVSAGYGEATVFEDVSVAVRPGEVLCVIGPSGAGKTTLLRLLGLLHRPRAGRVAIDGADVWALDEGRRLRARRRVSMVFQESNLFDASVRRNVAYGVRVRRPWRERLRGVVDRFRSDDTAGAVDEALAAVDLGDLGDRHAGTLSGGEAKRVAFARALAVEPAALLLDEPTSDLDPRNTAAIEAAVDAARERGIGVVLATHDMHQARRVADRVGVLLDGSLIEVGPTEAVFESPADPRARQFIDGELVY